VNITLEQLAFTGVNLEIEATALGEALGTPLEAGQASLQAFIEALRAKNLQRDLDRGPILSPRPQPHKRCNMSMHVRITPMSMTDFILSAKTVGRVMNFPLYDGNVSEKARRLIADGKLDEALAEYRRLADLGSGLAKCVLAYLSLRDLPGAPRSVEAAKALATGALGSEPGYASYILSYAAIYENNPAKAIDLMCDSYRAHFIPSASALGLILGQGYGVSKHPKEAEVFFKRAVLAGHLPAPLLLCRFYLQGRLGLVKQIVGMLLLPLSMVYVWLPSRFVIFSVYAFRHFNASIPPMFNERALRT
jgi:hypothetical protein